jgi:hypothetical protein
MPALTRLQLEHAKQRLAEAKKKYIVAKVAELGPSPDEFELSREEKIARIKAGRATFIGDVDTYGYCYDAFAFTLTPEEEAKKAQYDLWHDAREAIIANATTTEEQIIDKLVMSPDGMGALTMIAEAFED